MTMHIHARRGRISCLHRVLRLLRWRLWQSSSMLSNFYRSQSTFWIIICLATTTIGDTAQECNRFNESERFRLRLSQQCPTAFEPICDEERLFGPLNTSSYRCSIALPGTPSPNRITLLNTTELQTLLKFRDPLGRSWCMIVFFFAHNCIFSAQFAPQFIDLPKHSQLLRVVAVNADEFSRMNMRYGISGTPTTILWTDGMGVVRLDGHPPKNNSLLEFIQSHTDLSLYRNESLYANETGEVEFQVNMEMHSYYELLNFFGSLLICICSLLYMLRDRILALDAVEQLFRKFGYQPIAQGAEGEQLAARDNVIN